jgi:hypothetical protein
MEVAFYKLNTKKRVDSLKNSGISVMNQKLIFNFVNYCFSEGSVEHRALKYLSTLKIVAKSISMVLIRQPKKIFMLMLAVLKDRP